MRFTGVIDSRFEQGYMITLSLPSQKLKGILYKQAQQHLKLPGAPRHGREDTTVSQELESGLDMGKRMRTAGPTLPRPARTPFQFFQLGVNKEQVRFKLGECACTYPIGILRRAAWLLIWC